MRTQSEIEILLQCLLINPQKSPGIILVTFQSVSSINSVWEFLVFLFEIPLCSGSRGKVVAVVKPRKATCSATRQSSRPGRAAAGMRRSSHLRPINEVINLGISLCSPNIHYFQPKHMRRLSKEIFLKEIRKLRE